MTTESLTALADAVAKVLSAQVDDGTGFVLVLLQTHKGGDLIYRSDCVSADVADVLRTVADEIEAIDV